MKKIAVVTSTRAEYGLLAPVIKKLRDHESSEFKVDLIVTGTHLSIDYGYTVNEIKDDNIRIDHEVTIPIKSASEYDISNNQAEALLRFTDLFIKQRYDAIVILGDRYEMLAIAMAAGNTNTPIFHLCGGDTTEGAKDEWIRHSITKMSYLHFVTNEISRKRVIQLGEDPTRVFNYGSTSIDNILKITTSKKEALDSICLGDCNYALCTYHPVTLENESVEESINEFLEAIKDFPDLQFIITKSNADQGGAQINALLDNAAQTMYNLNVYSSLGVKRYLSLMKHCEFVLGNSSSGIIEAPALHVPTVNIGDRQKGRLQAVSIINCGKKAEEIKQAIINVQNYDHQKLCKGNISLYGDGHSGEKIANKIMQILNSNSINLKKEFYDIK